jgi:fibronectin type 3 domain-containing protein
MRRSPRSALAGLAGLLSLAACAGVLDFDRAREVLQPTRPPPLPPLLETRAELPVPEGLRAASGELRAVPLQWDPLLTPSVAGYAVERALAAEGPFARIAAVADNAATAFVDGNAGGDGATLYYRVRAFAPTGALAADPSAVVAATTAPAPAPPTGFRAYSHQPRSVPLAWEPSPDPTVGGYVVERSPSARGPFERLAQLEGRHSTVYVDRGLGDLRVFYYRIAAVNRAGGPGPISDAIRAVTKPDPLPPTGLRLAGQRLGANRIEWEPNVEPDIVTYRVFRIRGAGRELLAELPANQTSAEDAGVGADERAAYSVIAVDRDGLDSEPAAAFQVASVGYGLVATARPGGVLLAWERRAEEGFRGARVMRHGALRALEVGFSEDGTWVDRDAVPGGRYRYSVVLERPDGSRAPPSSPVEITLPRGKTPVR